MRNDALREAVGFHLLLEGQFSQAGHEPPVPADDPLYHPFGGEVVEATLFTIALARGVDKREALWGARFDKTPLEGEGQFFREPYPDEAAGGHGIAVHDHAGGVFGGDDLVSTQETPVPLHSVAFRCAPLMPLPWDQRQDTHREIMCKASPGWRPLWCVRSGIEVYRFKPSGVTVYISPSTRTALPRLSRSTG